MTQQYDLKGTVPPVAINSKRGHRVLTSSVLFSGQTEVKIVHAGVEYTLRITKENKLILTK